MGQLSLKALVALEEDTEKKVYQLFDEIWGTSIGSLIAALLTTPAEGREEPLAAAEVLQFLNDNVFGGYFSSGPKVAGYLQPLGIRGALRNKLSADFTLDQTLIPVRIVTAKVTEWQYGIVPKESCLVGFGSDDLFPAYLSDVVCASCNVFGIWPTSENIRYESAQGALYPLEDSFPEAMPDKSACYIDPALMIGTHERCMDPIEFFADRSVQRKYYFIGNGWVSRHGHVNEDGDVLAINFDYDLAFGPWHDSRTEISKKYCGTMRNRNFAGAGFMPKEYLELAAKDLKLSREYQAMLNDLLNSSI